ncbi:threonine/serine exporter family protein [Clostridium cadaveris]|uniref:threonine/serine exporter family protein n=1 Tax=Clostridium cadaveris TaxID=1529 RepID=UPI0031D47B8A
MDIDRILRLAVYAGQIMLESGGEIFRTEETIIRICNAYEIKNAESLVLPTGIMVSVSSKYCNTQTYVKRVKTMSWDLEKVSRINTLSRNLAVKAYSLDDFEAQLDEINSITGYNNKTKLFSAALAASCFSILFGSTFHDFICTFFIGILLRFVAVWCGRINLNQYFVNALSGMLGAIMAISSVHFGLGDNVDTITIGAIMLLVPGLLITNAIRDTMHGDLVAGLTRGAEAFLVAISIALGTAAIFLLKIHMGGI